MKKKSRAPDKHKNAAILKAAGRLFLKNGYSSTSMDAVAALAGVTKQTVYSHFSSKDALFTSMVSDLCQKYTPPSTPAKNMYKTPEIMLQKFGFNFLTLITSPEGLNVTRLVIAEAARYPKLAQLYYERGTMRLTKSLSEALDNFNREKQTNIHNTLSAASYFFALLKSRYHLRMMLSIKPAPTQKDKAGHVNEAVKIFMRIYGGDAPLETRSVY